MDGWVACNGWWGVGGLGDFFQVRVAVLDHSRVRCGSRRSFKPDVWARGVPESMHNIGVSLRRDVP